MNTAHLIRSQEYRMNSASVFVFLKNKYYGCKVYPSLRSYPEDVNYWNGATSSDSDRGFNVTTVSVSEDITTKIEQLQAVIDACTPLAARKSWPTIKRTWTIRRGKAYQEWCILADEQAAAIQAESDRVAPYEKAMYHAMRELRTILVSLPEA